MASNSVKYSATAGFTANPLVCADDASLQISDTDSYIFGGWVKIVIGGGNQGNQIFGMKGGDTNTTKSYGFSRNGNGVSSVIRFFARESSSTVKLASSGAETVGDNTNTFVLGWVDPIAGKVYLRINAGTIYETALSLSSFTDPGGDLTFFRAEDGTSSNRDTFDEWFFCKNPPNLAIALSYINTYVYNSGFGNQYANLPSDVKTALGLVSWWGFDETSGTRFDLHGNNDFTPDVNIESASALISGSFLFTTLSESLTPSDDRNNLIGLGALTETLIMSESITHNFHKMLVETLSLAESFAIVDQTILLSLSDVLTLTDNIIKSFDKVVFETLFLSDSIHISPLLSTLTETLNMSVWLQVKLNPPVSHWTD